MHTRVKEGGRRENPPAQWTYHYTNAGPSHIAFHVDFVDVSVQLLNGIHDWDLNNSSTEYVLTVIVV